MRGCKAFWLVAMCMAGVTLPFGVARFYTPEPQSARLVFHQQNIPAQVFSEADLVWRHLEEAVGERLGCIPPVGVELVFDLEHGDARYLKNRALIEIKIPTSPRRFRESLAHEIAHHIESRCKDFPELQTQLWPLINQDIAELEAADIETAPFSAEAASNDMWFSGKDWFSTPSEHYAEAFVAAIGIERVRFARQMPTNPALVDSIAAWAQKEN